MQTSPDDQATIGIVLSAPLVLPRTKKRFLGGHYLSFADVTGIMGFMHHNGLLIAEAMPDKHLELMFLFGDKIDQRGLSGTFRRATDRRLSSYRESMNLEPSSSIQLMTLTEYQKVGVFMHPSTPLKKVEGAASAKIPIEVAGNLFTLSLGEGIGLGFAYPDLARSMLETSNQIDDSAISEAREYGLEIPSQIQFIDIQDQKRTILELVTRFATQYRPDLINGLDL